MTNRAATFENAMLNPTKNNRGTTQKVDLKMNRSRSFATLSPMKPLIAFVAVTALVTFAAFDQPEAAQAASPRTVTPPVTYYSAADLQSIGAQLGTDSKHANFKSKDLEHYNGHYTMLAHREATGSAEVHVHEADLFFVVSGQATIVTGGKMLNAKTERPGSEIRGTSIEGGDRRTLSPGDVIHIAANIPHQLLLDPGKQFTYFVMKVTNQ